MMHNKNRRGFPRRFLHLRSGLLRGGDDFTVGLFELLDMLQQNIFDIVGHGAVLAGCESADLVKYLVRQTKCENPLCGSHSVIPFSRFHYGM